MAPSSTVAYSRAPLNGGGEHMRHLCGKHVRTHTHTHTHTYIHTYIHTHTRTRTRTRTRARARRTHTRTHAHTHTRTHAHARVPSLKPLCLLSQHQCSLRHWRVICLSQRKMYPPFRSPPFEGARYRVANGVSKRCFSDS